MIEYKRFLQSHVSPHWKTLVVILTPLLLLPLLFTIEGSEARAGYGILIISISWLTLALPVAITCLLPILIFPLLDIMSTGDVCALYIKESNIIFFCGIVLALGVEKSNLHRRVAFRTLMTIGTNPKWLMLVFMMASMLLSLWISSAGVIAMLIPVVEAVVEAMFPKDEEAECDEPVEPYSRPSESGVSPPGIEQSMERGDWQGVMKRQFSSAAFTAPVNEETIEKSDSPNSFQRQFSASTITTSGKVELTERRHSGIPNGIPNGIKRQGSGSSITAKRSSIDRRPSEILNGIKRRISGLCITIQERENQQPMERMETDADALTELKRRIKVPLLISVCYAGSIGQAGTLIGTEALAFKGILDELYGAETGVSFTSWMAVGTPFAVITTFFAWVWLQIIFDGYLKQAGSNENGQSSVKNKKDINTSIRNQHKELGPISFYENSIIGLFSLLTLLWLFKEPQFMPGWESALPTHFRIGDATLAIGVVVLTFILPSQPRFWLGENTSSISTLMDWPYVQRKFPWTVLLLFGAGCAVAEVSQTSGLTHSIGNNLSLSSLAALPPFAIMVFTSLLASMATELVSNTAVVSILVPIAAQIAETTKLNPLYLMIPATISCCHAFMLRVGTPCNTMVFSAGKMKTSEMLKAGIVMNIIAMIVVCAVMETLGVSMFDLRAEELPYWATKSHSTST